MSGPSYPITGFKPTNITDAANHLLKTGAGILGGLTVNTPHAGATIAIYDGVDNTGTLIGTFSAAAAASFLCTVVGTSFKTGLFAVTAGGTPADITVYWF